MTEITRVGAQNMQAVWIPRHGDGSVLQVRSSQEPTYGDHDVLIDVVAAGLNFAEVSARQGIYPAAPKPPCIVGYEGAGVVRAIGKSVTTLKAGDRVFYMCRFGGHASVVSIPAHQAIRMPEAMTFEEGAALPVNYLTAYHIIHNIHRTRPGDRVLVHMAAGGVGTAALQMLAAIGNVTTFGTASASKHPYVRALGCMHVIDYRTQDYVAEVNKLGGKVDLVMDALGAKDWTRGYSLLTEGGLLACFGFANAAVPGKRNLFLVLKSILGIKRYSPLDLMEKNRGVVGVDMGGMWHRTDMMQNGLQAIADLYTQGKVKPQIEGIYTFADARKAYERLEFGKNQGKVLLKP